MIFTPLKLLGAYRIDLQKITDSRGFFARVFSAFEFKQLGLESNWVQMNSSFSETEGTIRGLHFQREPAQEAKMVRCLHGAIFDVMVDLRPNSPTYSKWESIILTPANRSMAYIPQGFAHGFQTLEPNSEALYWHSKNHSPPHEAGIRFDDPALAVSWPKEAAAISERDLKLPSLAEWERSVP